MLELWALIVMRELPLLVVRGARERQVQLRGRLQLMLVEVGEALGIQLLELRGVRQVVLLLVRGVILEQWEMRLRLILAVAAVVEATAAPGTVVGRAAAAWSFSPFRPRTIPAR